MRLRLLVLGLYLAMELSVPVQATPMPVTFKVMPGGTVLEDVDVTPGRVLATASLGAVGTVQCAADSGNRHQYRLGKPPYDSMSMTIWWDAAHHTWQYRAGSAAPAMLNAMTVVSLTRTIRLNVSPADAAAYTDAEQGNASDSSPSDQVLDVAGALRRVVPLARRGDMVVIPHALSPPVLYLAHPRFLVRMLTIPAKALDQPGDVYPPNRIDLSPKYGPLSYPTFDICLAGLVVCVLVAGRVYIWPRQMARRQRQAAEHHLVETIKTHSPESVEVRMRAQAVETEAGHRYVLLKVLGQGAYGVVYRGTGVGDGAQAEVAIKLLTQARWEDLETQTRFKREVQACATLQHPAIVKVLDWGACKEGDRVIPFMVMELVGGRTLSQVLADAPHGLPPKQVAGWLGETLAGLRVAHEAGLIHRDIKPQNLMVTERGHIKIMDFGAARDLSQALTASDTSIGTPLYMSPEHFDARTVSPASDVYSVGMVGYELLTGRPAFSDTGNMWQLVNRVMTDDYPHILTVNPAVPALLADIIMKMTARAPENRYADAASAMRALAALEL